MTIYDKEMLAETSLEILMRFSRVGNARTYGEVMGCAFGSAGRRVLQICVLVNNFGILVIYMIIIGNACVYIPLASYMGILCCLLSFSSLTILVLQLIDGVLTWSYMDYYYYYFAISFFLNTSNVKFWITIKSKDNIKF